MKGLYFDPVRNRQINIDIDLTISMSIPLSFLTGELLKFRKIVMSKRYQQLMHLSDEIKRKQPYIGQGTCQVILLYDNARFHSAMQPKN